MEAMYRKVMDRGNQFAPNIDPTAMIALRDRLRSIVSAASPPRRVVSTNAAAAAAAADSTVIDAPGKNTCGACNADDVNFGPHGYVIVCKGCNMPYHPQCVLDGMAQDDDVIGYFQCDNSITVQRGQPSMPAHSRIGSKRPAPPTTKREHQAKDDTRTKVCVTPVRLLHCTALMMMVVCCKTMR